MNALDAYRDDVMLQTDFIKSFQGRTPIPAGMQPRVVFAGSGDSLAASMLAESFSGGVVRAMDPLDLHGNRRLLINRTVYFVSVSGSTISNIRAARSAASSVAMTANPDSRLAKSCTRTIQLRFPSSGLFTAGSISFLASALECMSLVKRFKVRHAGRIFAAAESAAKKTKTAGRVFILGDYDTYPLAMYCAAKFYEILGTGARYCKIEQFSHMELFSAKKGDTVIVFGGQPRLKKKLAGQLSSAGIGAVLPEFQSRNMVSRILFYVFYSQLLPLEIADRTGQSDCSFILAKKLRSISNIMIY